MEKGKTQGKRRKKWEKREKEVNRVETEDGRRGKKRG